MTTADPLTQQITTDLLAKRAHLRAYIRKSVAQEADVDDIFQQTLIRVIERARRADIEKPLQYAYRVAQNLIVDAARAQKTEWLPLDEEPVCERTDVELQLDRQQRLRTYQQALESMPELRRKVFVLYRLKGESKNAIAEQLGLSQASINKHLTRALASLKQAVEQVLPE